MDLTALGPLIAGPASAVFVMLVVLFGIWKFATTHLIPILSAALDRLVTSFDELVKTNQADHKAMLESLQGIEAKLEHSARVAKELRINGRA